MTWEDFIKKPKAEPDFQVKLEPASTLTNRQIYDAFRAAGMTAEGACGLMGNMMAESGMQANIAQRGMTQMSDIDYTVAADNGTIDFVNDAVGYGYIQLTHHTRKAKYLAYCKQNGKSVGDAQAQVNFIILELTADYPMIMLTLRTSHDINECADRVCDKYERPAINNYPTRRQYAHEFYNEFSGSGALSQEHAEQYPTDIPATTQTASSAGVKAAVMVLQMIMNYAGYWGEVTGERSAEFYDALDTFVADLKKM